MQTSYNYILLDWVCFPESNLQQMDRTMDFGEYALESDSKFLSECIS